MCQTIFYVKIEILLRISEGFLAASSQKRRDGSSANGQTLIHHDILLTAENIIIVQALHLMSEHQSEFERLKAATPRFSLDMQFFAPQFFAVPYSSVGIDLQPQTLEKEEYDVPQGADVIIDNVLSRKLLGEAQEFCWQLPIPDFLPG